MPHTSNIQHFGSPNVLQIDLACCQAGFASVYRSRPIAEFIVLQVGTPPTVDAPGLETNEFDIQA
jgi:hypothetical protein